MQFSQTTCSAQTQLRPILCIGSASPSAAGTSPPAPACPLRSFPLWLAGQPGYLYASQPRSWAGNRSSWKITAIPSSLTKSCISVMWGNSGRTRSRDGLFQPRSEQRLYLSSCSLPLLSQNITSQGPWPPTARAPSCPNATNNSHLDKRLN